MNDPSVHFSSNSVEWATPDAFFQTMNDEYRFDLDVCATTENHKADQFFSPEDDGLAQEWAPHRCWMNPPYGREIKRWMKKAYSESLKGALVVCLVPARTDTAWFQDYAMRGEITFLRGRLKFGGSKNSAPFPSAVVVFKPCPLSDGRNKK